MPDEKPYQELLRALLLCGICFWTCVGTARAQSAGQAPPPQANAPAPAGGSSPGKKSSASSPSLANAQDLYRSGKLDEAAREYNALAAAGTNAAPAYAALAQIYLRQRNTEDAYTAAAKAIELGPADPAAHAALGEIYFRQGKLADAEREFLTLARAGTKNGSAYLGLSRVYQAASYYKQAKRMIEMAYAADPADPDIQEVWLEYLSLPAKIKTLQEQLSKEANDDAKGQGGLQRELNFLQGEAAQPARPCRLATTIRSVQTSLKELLSDPKHLRGYGLSVKLNGTPSTLMLDTGAGGILVDSKIAEKAGIKRIGETHIGGIGDKGQTPGYVGYVDSIRIGDLEFQNCYVEVAYNRSALDVDGLIGGDVFSNFLVDLDFPDEKLKLSELPARPGEEVTSLSLESRSAADLDFHDPYVAPEMKSFTPIYRFRHMILVPTRLNDSVFKLFLLDTGALLNSITPAAAREITKVSTNSDVSIKGLSGNVNNVFRAHKLTLTFDHLRQENYDMVSFDLTGISDSLGTEVSGTLGFALLNKMDIKIDYRDGLVDFTPGPKR